MPDNKKQKPLEQRWAEEEEGVVIINEGNGHVPEEDPNDTIDDFIRDIEEADTTIVRGYGRETEDNQIIRWGDYIGIEKFDPHKKKWIEDLDLLDICTGERRVHIMTAEEISEEIGEEVPPVTEMVLPPEEPMTPEEEDAFDEQFDVKDPYEYERHVPKRGE